MARPISLSNIPTQKHIDHYNRKPRATHCRYGHEFTKENSLYCYADYGNIRRRCKKCRTSYYSNYHKSQKNYEHWTNIMIGGV